MCVLIVCRAPGARFPVLVGANREEDPSRPSAPPGVRQDGVRRMLAPHDRRHGGTWIGVNDAGVLAAVTNWAHAPSDPGGTSRGAVTIAALRESDVERAMSAVVAHVAREPVRPFQALVADAERTLYLRAAGGVTIRDELTSPLSVLTNRHGPRELEVPGLASWLEQCRSGEHEDVEGRLDHVVVTLATGIATDMATGQRVPLCREDGNPRTVSASVLALPAEVGRLRFRYCDGSPRTAVMRDYSILASQLIEG